MISHPGIVKGVSLQEVCRAEVRTITRFSTVRCKVCHVECVYGRFGACKGQLLVPLNGEGGEDHEYRN